MTRRLRDAIVGLLYLVLIAALITLSVMVYNHDFTSYTTVALRTDSVGNALQDGSDVKVRGVFVGTVRSIDTDGDGAVVHLQLDPAKVASLPANMRAQLLPKTLFGERYVSLEFPADPSSARLHSGDTIEQDRTPQSIELEKLFTDLLPVLQAVDPQKLSASLGELAAALRGRGSDLAATMATVGHYLDQLSPHVPQITDDLEALSRVARTYSGAAPDIVAGLNSLTATSRTFVSQRAQYVGLLHSVTTMADTVGAFVNTNQQQIIGLSRDSLPSLRVFARYSSEFPCTAQTLTNYIPVADKAFGAGTTQPGAHVILHVVGGVQPYTVADRPRFDSRTGPRCPYAPETSLAGTALANVPGVVGANHDSAGSSSSGGSSSSSSVGSSGSAGMGSANSPQENQLIAELEAPTAGLAPSAYPKWASLLVGPALRGTQVTVK